MDQLTLQRNLAVLENHYRELREIGEGRLHSWEAEKAILKQTLEQLDSELSDMKANIHQSDLIRLQLRQAQEELDVMHQQLDLMHQQLDTTQRQLQIRSLQLQQAHEELDLSADDLQYLQTWRHQMEYSMKNQLKLIRKTLGIRCIEHVRWILPTGFLRSHKLRINSFLRQ
jgi:DNA repair exonuclease SbcCD ATPase subunit